MQDSLFARTAIPDLHKSVRNLLLVAVPTLSVLVVLSLRSTDFTTLRRTMNWRYVIGLLILAIVKWLTDSWRLQLIVRFSGGRVSLGRSFQIFMASVFGANTTPFYAGSVVTQAYFLARFALSPGRSVAIGTVYGLLNLAVNFLFSLVVLASPSLIAMGPHRLAFVGLAGMMVLLSVLLFLLTRHPDRTEKLVHGLLRRKPDAVKSAVGTLHEFSAGLTLFLSGHNALAELLVVSLVSQILSLLFTPLAFRALGLTNVPVAKILLTQVGVQFSASLGATPGGIGIIDGVFALFFQPLAGLNTAALTLLWRMATFYLPTLVGAVVFIVLLRRDRTGRSRGLSRPGIETTSQQSNTEES